MTVFHLHGWHDYQNSTLFVSVHFNPPSTLCQFSFIIHGHWWWSWWLTPRRWGFWGRLMVSSIFIILFHYTRAKVYDSCKPHTSKALNSFCLGGWVDGSGWEWEGNGFYCTHITLLLSGEYEEENLSTWQSTPAPHLQLWTEWLERQAAHSETCCQAPALAELKCPPLKLATVRWPGLELREQSGSVSWLDLPSVDTNTNNYTSTSIAADNNECLLVTSVISLLLLCWMVVVVLQFSIVAPFNCT